MSSILPYFNSGMTHTSVNHNPSPVAKFFQKELNIKIAKVVAGILAFAALCAGTGNLVQMAAKQWKPSNADDNSLIAQAKRKAVVALEILGKGLYLTGKYAFLSVAVPFYTVSWVLPKWMINEGIPKAAKLTHKYVLIPVGNQIVKALEYLNKGFVKIANAIYDYAIAPFKRVIKDAVDWTWKTVILPVYNGLAKVANHVKDTVVKAARVTYDYVIQPVSRTAVKAAKWTWNNMIIPTHNVLKKVFVHVKNATTKIAKVACDYILNPLSRVAIKIAKWTWNTVIIPVYNGLVKMVGYVKDATIKTAKLIYDHVLAPVKQVVVKATNWIKNTVVIPVWNRIAQAQGYLKNTVVKAAQAVYHFAILPTGQFVAKAFWTTYGYAEPLCKAVVQAGGAALNSIYESYVWLSAKIS